MDTINDQRLVDNKEPENVEYGGGLPDSYAWRPVIHHFLQ
jgi:hypothetical protein